MNFTKGEVWTKVVGPIFNYVNTGATPDEMFKDALAQAAKEKAAWPYKWLQGVDYPKKSDRATVRGHLMLNDPQGSGKMTHVLVGLTHADYTVMPLPPTSRPASTQPRGGAGGGGRGDPDAGAEEEEAGGGGPRGPRLIDWQQDAKYYEFWTRGEDNGRFKIENVRPGNYTLHAIASGVLGEYAKANITVKAGERLDLGKLDWQPVRYGKQLWDIGIPDRTASEFLHGDHYWEWGLYLKYANDFPNDVNYFIGKSDYHKDWNYVQVPHGDGKNYDVRGGPTTWSIHYNLPREVKGKATLRLGICGGNNLSIGVSVNGKTAGSVGPLTYTATINRDGITGQWVEKDLTFDAAMMHTGENVLQLSIPGGGLTNGVEYDYVRLEVDEQAAATRLTAKNSETRP